MSSQQPIESYFIEEGSAMDPAANRPPASEYFGHLTFTGDVMMRRLPPTSKRRLSRLACPSRCARRARR